MKKCWLVVFLTFGFLMFLVFVNSSKPYQHCESRLTPHQAEIAMLFFVLKISVVDMKKEKEKCGDCKFLKYIDGEGYGFCSLLEESDVQVIDEACVEFEKDDEDVE